MNNVKSTLDKTDLVEINKTGAVFSTDKLRNL